jgi:hypothetical protein
MEIYDVMAFIPLAAAIVLAVTYRIVSGGWT